MPDQPSALEKMALMGFFGGLGGALTGSIETKPVTLERGLAHGLAHGGAQGLGELLYGDTSGGLGEEAAKGAVGGATLGAVGGTAGGLFDPNVRREAAIEYLRNADKFKEGFRGRNNPLHNKIPKSTLGKYVAKSGLRGALGLGAIQALLSGTAFGLDSDN